VANFSTSPDVVTVILTSTVVAGIVTASMNAFLAWRANTRAATFSAIRIATTLERFAQTCIAQLHSHTLAGSTGGLVGQSGVSLPEFPSYSTDIDWKSLPTDLVERALSLANSVDQDSRSLIQLVGKGEEEGEDFTMKEMTNCALKASALSEDLRRRFGFPALPTASFTKVTLLEYSKLVSERQVSRAQTRLKRLQEGGLS
jgi:hypothetical protein